MWSTVTSVWSCNLATPCLRVTPRTSRRSSLSAKLVRRCGESEVPQDVARPATNLGQGLTGHDFRQLASLPCALGEHSSSYRYCAKSVT